MTSLLTHTHFRTSHFTDITASVMQLLAIILLTAGTRDQLDDQYNISSLDTNTLPSWFT